MVNILENMNLLINKGDVYLLSLMIKFMCEMKLP